MRLAILGNSHAACLLMALGETPDLLGPGVTCTVYAAAGRHMDDLALEGDRLVASTDALRKRIAQTSDGETEIDLTRFDAFLLVGMQYRIRPIPLSCSRAVAHAAMIGGFMDSIAWRLARRIRLRSDKPIHVLHGPLPARPDTPGSDAYFGYDDQLGMLAPPAQKQALELVRQPLQTRVDDVFTRPEFSRGSRRLGTGDPHPDEDVLHMNGAFGRVVLESVAGHLAH